MRALTICVIAAIAMLAVSARDAAGTITTIAGGGAGDGGRATSAALYHPPSVAIDAGGRLYIADAYNCRVREESGGTINTAAGNGSCGYARDGGLATSATLGVTTSVATDAAGNVYIAEASQCRVWELSKGVIRIVVNSFGVCGNSSDGEAASGAALNDPRSVALDGAGNLYIAETGNCRVRRVSGGIISTVVGNGACGFSGDGGAATSAALNEPAGLALDGAGSLYVADTSNNRVRKGTDGIITTIAGGCCSGDGAPATSANLYRPAGIALDGAGNLYIADTYNCRVREVSGGIISTVAGTTCGFAGDDGAATSAALNHPAGLALDSARYLYIADTDNCRVRQVRSAIITTIAGTGFCGFSGDGGTATDAALWGPADVALDSSGNLYIADQQTCRVRELHDGIIATVAGNGTCGYSGDGGPPIRAALNGPGGVALDAAGDLYIADTYNCRVREVSGGTIATVAGSSGCGFSGDGGPPTIAELTYPSDVALDSAGNLYIADTYNCRVREVSGGTIATAAGSGGCGFSGDGGPATGSQLTYPYDVGLDSAGNLYIADTYNCRVREVSGGIITTVAGGTGCGFSADGAAIGSAINRPTAVAIDGAGHLYIADTYNCRVREVSGATITTVAGSGTCGYGGDGRAATGAGLAYPAGIAVDLTGNLYIADSGNNRVREGFAAGDSDGDGCPDAREQGHDHRLGGDRDPASPWDFFDVPVPAITPPNPFGSRDKAVSIADVLAVVYYVGTFDGGGPNANGVSYNTDLNSNGIPDGREYDRTPSSETSKPWRSGPPNGAVTMQDALVALIQVGDNCN